MAIETRMIVKSLPDLETDLRLRILAYHLRVIVELKPREFGYSLHTVKGMLCAVARKEDGSYLIEGKECATLGDAIETYIEILSTHTTGLHRDE